MAQAGKLGDSLATEAVVSMGDVLYVPSFWFHYIVSQDASVQCNARSGYSPIGSEEIKKCGVMEKEREDEGGEYMGEKAQEQHDKGVERKRLRKARKQEDFRKQSFHMDMEN